MYPRPGRGRIRQLVPYLHIPVFVEIIKAGDTSSIAVRIVDMFQIAGSRARITGHHSLDEK